MLAVAGRLPRAPRPLSVSCHVEFFNMAARKENLYSISASKMEPQERYCDHGSFLSFLPYSVGQKKVISQWKGITQRHGHKEVRVTGDHLRSVHNIKMLSLRGYLFQTYVLLIKGLK